MSLKGIKKTAGTGGGDKTFTLPKKGQRPARLVGLVDVGVQEVDAYKGKVKKPCQHMIPMYALMKDHYEDEEGESHVIVKCPWPIRVYPGSDKGYYKEFCIALDPEGEVMEEGEGDLTKLLGRTLLVNVSYTAKKLDDGSDVVYANVAGVFPAPDDYPVPEYEGELLYFDMDEPDLEVFNKLSERIQGIIKEGIEYAGSAAQIVIEGKASKPKPQREERELPHSSVPEQDFDDDIPF